MLRRLASLVFRVRVESDLHALRAEPFLKIANHESFLNGLPLGTGEIDCVAPKIWAEKA